MAKQELRSFFLILFVSSIVFVSCIQARPLSVSDGGTVVYEFDNNLALGAIKTSGPSPRGIGHLSVGRVTKVIAGGNKSGPSRGGVGHSYVNGIVGKKNSGPSPGKGH
ncbi:hypothetical protein MKW94_016855 [Papaver nudicaule]|uniref:Uncharacterized protein n=1 Tax=Papaver nudicaule TaxID=74823 RepID=A0AA41VT99_PAPNU|nr:hypothetical protein [Papaver nudicaule]